MILKAGPATWAIVTSLVAMFLVEWSKGALGNDQALLALGALSDSKPPGSELWRIATYAWLHANTTHLFLNAALLLWTGGIVERRIGAVKMLVVYLAGVLMGGLAIAIRADMAPKPGVSLGASAAVYAILFCSIVLLFGPDDPRFRRSVKARTTLLVVAAIGVGVSFIKGVSLVGHAAGIVVGLLFGFLLLPGSPLHRAIDTRRGGRSNAGGD